MDAKAPSTVPVSASPSAPAPSITDLARIINDKVAQMVNAARTSFTRAIEVGELLKQAKDRVGHGNFEAWVNDHCSFSYRSARRYMKLADDRPKLEEQLKVEAPGKLATVANLNLASAQRLLAPPPAQREEGQGGTKPKSSPTDQYKQIETDLIDCLKHVDRSKAEGFAANTVLALNDTVDDIKRMIEEARAKRM
jgi:hypothetical protein